MLLHTIEIQNYRSLEHVKLDNLQHFNVLIGRNNAGKSSVFLALQQLGQVFQRSSFPPEVLTDRNPSRSLEIQLTFKPRSQEREVFIDLLIAAGPRYSSRLRMISTVSMILSCVVTLPLMIPDDKNNPCTELARWRVSKPVAISSGVKVTRLVLLRPARKGQ